MTLKEVLEKHGISQGWGGCNDGWAGLIDKLVEDLIETGWDPKGECAQIKEKFGGLRFYVNKGLTDEQYELIAQAERDSYITCERCGKLGELKRSPTNWLRTICPECGPDYKPLREEP